MRTNHAIPLVRLARAAGHHPPRWHARLQARVAGHWLDRQLADGVASWRSPSHAARALQLTSDRRRHVLARSLEGLIDRANDNKPTFASAVVTPCREQVQRALPEILAVVFRLRSTSPLDVRGIARLRELLGDGGGPCYARIHPDALAIALQDVSEWMDVDD
jgi:hypothetical protein